MNERIEKFALQAKEYADTKYSKLVSTSRWGDCVPSIRELYTEKLAELIVRECIQTIQLGITRDGTMTEKFKRSITHIKDIKEHFGVDL